MQLLIYDLIVIWKMRKDNICNIPYTFVCLLYMFDLHVLQINVSVILLFKWFHKHNDSIPSTWNKIKRFNQCILLIALYLIYLFFRYKNSRSLFIHYNHNKNNKVFKYNIHLLITIHIYFIPVGWITIFIHQ